MSILLSKIPKSLTNKCLPFSFNIERKSFSVFYPEEIYLETFTTIDGKEHLIIDFSLLTDDFYYLDKKEKMIYEYAERIVRWFSIYHKKKFNCAYIAEFGKKNFIICDFNNKTQIKIKTKNVLIKTGIYED